MKFNCCLTDQEKIAALEPILCTWHEWFAWYPVRVGRKDCRWLEVVERKGDFVYCNMFGVCTALSYWYREVRK